MQTGTREIHPRVLETYSSCYKSLINVLPKVLLDGFDLVADYPLPYAGTLYNAQRTWTMGSGMCQLEGSVRVGCGLRQKVDGFGNTFCRMIMQKVILHLRWGPHTQCPRTLVRLPWHWGSEQYALWSPHLYCNVLKRHFLPHKKRIDIISWGWKMNRPIWNSC